MVALLVTLIVLLYVGVCPLHVSGLTLPPRPVILNAPFTPFHDDQMRSVNVDPIPTLATYAASQGVNTVWVCGGLGQFETLKLDERKAIAEAWVKAAGKHKIYVIVHVGSNVLAEAIDLAQHASSIGADAIASVPSYYESPYNVSLLVDWLQPIAAAAPDLGFFYYHIPSETHESVQIFDLMQLVTADGPTRIPNFVGIKYVDDDLYDFLQCTQTYGNKVSFLWAPEPKLAALGFAPGGAVLAEDFFAGTYLRMSAAFDNDDLPEARREQLWKLSASTVFGRYGGGHAERYVYRRLCGIDLGPPRRPGQPLPGETIQAMFADLETASDFFNKTAGKC